MQSNLFDKLISDGWIQQFTVSGPRLQEAIENYRELGFEVKTVPAREIDTNDCNVCFENAADETMMIFTRKAES